MTTSTPSPPQSRTASVGPEASVPVLWTLRAGPMVPGGHCVAQHQGQVVFVRHAIPGETVVARVTEAGPAPGVYWADTVQVLRASEFRRAHPWKLADPLRSYPVGRRPVAGAEYGHITLEHQRRLKTQVFRDTLARAGGPPAGQIHVHVAGVAADEPVGMHWRTRITLVLSPAGRVSFPVHRGPGTVPVRNIPPALPGCDELRLWEVDFSGAAGIELATAAHGAGTLINIHPTRHIAGTPRALRARMKYWRDQLSGTPNHVSIVVTTPPSGPGRPPLVAVLRGGPTIHDQVSSARYGARDFRLSGTGHWPVHRDAPTILVETVLAAARPQPGDVVVDLHAGPGLFSAFLAQAVGEQGVVVAIEPDGRASQDARDNLSDLSQAVVVNSAVEPVLAGWPHESRVRDTSGRLADRKVNTVVLNSLFAGAGPAVLDQLLRLNPDRIVHICSDPASLARDMYQLHHHGWHPERVDVYDLAPNTHQMTTVSVFTTTGPSSGAAA
ncbi:class I SAM-dependent RNA methyltransferase [uncultured Citricoccus sp.]|uniref:class I SAM-dependent RNA methyltransferase n=1 Tax=uncultured Citricoccus sp. TaxID=614031 RepID=UPI00260EC1D4|nr:TRAM domain-containing protein [uncultured Citricoccus sp.]